jgi:ferrous iron transport protein B
VTAAVSTPKKSLFLALAGNPNVGKSSLFNALTGLRQRVANYPGVTVDRHEGVVKRGDATFRVVDLPGLYSLVPRSPDERVAADVLAGKLDPVGGPPPVVVVVCCDAGFSLSAKPSISAFRRSSR